MDDMNYEDDDLPKLHALTIVWEEGANCPPQVDLGEMSPWVAITLLNMVAESLELVLHPPTIRYKDDIIFEAITDLDD